MREWEQTAMQNVGKARVQHAKQQRTVALTLGNSASVDTGQDVVQKTRRQQSNVPLNEALQAFPQRTQEQSPVQTLRRRRNNGADRHEWRSQFRVARFELPINHKTQQIQRATKKEAKKQSRGGDNKSVGGSTRPAFTKRAWSKPSTRPTQTRRPTAQQRKMSGASLKIE